MDARRSQQPPAAAGAHEGAAAAAAATATATTTAAYTNIRVLAEHALESPPPPPPQTKRPSSTNRHYSYNSNYVRSQAASPELISSLIDQLSAISQSTASHFEGSLSGPTATTATTATTLEPAAARRRPSRSRSRSRSRTPSPSATATATARPAGQHAPLGPDRSPYYSAIRDQNDLFPDDACEPPVVRTSKPPSGKSPITAPPRPARKDKPHSLAGYVARRASSSASIHSCHSHRSSSSFGNISIGNISIEAGPIPSKPVTLAAAGSGGAHANSNGNGSNRSSAESKRSVKRPRSLMYMSSRERLKQKETDTRKRLEDAASPDSPRKHASQLFSYEDTIKEEPVCKDGHDHSHDHGHDHDHDHDHDSYVIADPPRFVQQHHHPSRSGTSSPARRIRLNLVDGPPGDSPIEQGLVPHRGSSLRHSSPKKSKRSASKTKGKGKEPVERPHTIAVTVPEQPPTPEMDPEEQRRQKLLLELEQEEDEVAQRIKQLREQKLLREKTAAGKLPAHDAAASTRPVGKPDSSALPSPQDSPISILSPASSDVEKRTHDTMKAHKLLGISTSLPARSTAESDLNKPLPSIEPREPREPTRPPPLPPHLQHARHRSLTVNDSDDLPLPINYALALKTLDTSAPNSPRTPRVDSTQLTLPPPTSTSAPTLKSSRDGIKRSSSLSMGGRASFGRKANSMVVGSSKGHRQSASLTEERPATVRSASEEVTSGRHSSLSMASASNSFSLKQQKTLKKKRWSHPDLPAKAESVHNAKVDAAEAEARAHQHYPMNPWSPVIEERPTSLDSIDVDVDAYLHAPRLSQKIRHPQTGRIISFSEVGHPNGYAVFVCVGMGLTRFVMAFYDQLAATLNLRLITPERPGVAASTVDPNGTPLTWPDDVLIICQALKITKFSLLAHSAGAIYALATALRMPQHIRGRVHLLAPWIPPSQMAPIGLGRDSPPTQQLPRSQRFLRALPPSLLRVANSTFLSNQSASLHGPTRAPKSKRKTTTPQPASRTSSPAPRPLLKDNRRESMLLMDQILPSASTLTLTSTNTHDPAAEKARLEALSLAERARSTAYDERLTFAIWDRATAGANPATDLMVCLETKQTIGFRYEDINRPVVIHHGSKDSRVPVDNVRWLGKIMRKCEVRVLDGEQHGLMASARVMGNVLAEIAGEWEDWSAVVKQASIGDLRSLARRGGSFA